MNSQDLPIQTQEEIQKALDKKRALKVLLSIQQEFFPAEVISIQFKVKEYE